MWEETFGFRSLVTEQHLLGSYLSCSSEKTDSVCALEEPAAPARSGKQTAHSRRANRGECVVYSTAVSAVADSEDKWEVNLQLRSQESLQG